MTPLGGYYDYETEAPVPRVQPGDGTHPLFSPEKEDMVHGVLVSEVQETSTEERGNGIKSLLGKTFCTPLVMCGILFGSYGYTWTVHTLALEQDQKVKEEVKEQATEIKKDLNDRINRMEDRITEALHQLREEIMQDRQIH